MSDVHARNDALAASLDGADALICLGDLVLFLDYDDPASGVFGELFGAAHARTFVDLRTAGRFDDARAFSAGLWAARDDDRSTTVLEAVRAPVRRDVCGDARARLPHLRQRRRPAPVAGVHARRAPSPGRRGGGDRRSHGRLRRRRAPDGLPDAVRDQRGGVRGQGSRRRGCGHPVHPHPAGPARSSPTTSSRGASSGGVARCSRPSGGASRSCRCSGTCTSPSCSADAWAGRSASTSVTSVARGRPTCWTCEWSSGPREGPRLAGWDRIG